MRILTAENQAELIVKRSRFIAELQTVATQEEAREALRAKKEFWAAQGIAHVVHAFVIGPQANIVGCSDDGEPPGTAGRPALEVLKGSGVTNALLTIARFFGGIKLGTGGLVKAYGDSAKAVLAGADTAELVPRVAFSVSCGYAELSRIRQILQQMEAVVEKEEFTDSITLRGTMQEARFPEAAELCRNATRGASTLQRE
jgi:uncharacterized YigZ family protein